MKTITTEDEFKKAYPNEHAQLSRAITGKALAVFNTALVIGDDVCACYVYEDGSYVQITSGVVKYIEVDSSLLNERDVLLTHLGNARMSVNSLLEFVSDSRFYEYGKELLTDVDTVMNSLKNPQTKEEFSLYLNKGSLVLLKDGATQFNGWLKHVTRYLKNK
jgi:hypothetical protein